MPGRPPPTATAHAFGAGLNAAGLVLVGLGVAGMLLLPEGYGCVPLMLLPLVFGVGGGLSLVAVGSALRALARRAERAQETQTLSSD